MANVVVVKAFQGTVESVELHPSENSAWISLRNYVGAPADTTISDWWRAWVSHTPPSWYNHDRYGDCRILHARRSAESQHAFCAFEQLERP